MKSQEFFEKVVWKIKTLTPVHISSGGFLQENVDYFMEGRALRRFHYPSLVAEIPEEKLESTLQRIKKDGMRSLLPRPVKKAKKPQVEEDWKQILRASIGLPSAQENQIKEEPQEPVEETVSILDKAELYKYEIDFGNEGIGSRLQEMALDYYLHSFFPGSTLKGAIRTAFYVDTILKEPNRLNRLRFTWTSNPIEADYPLDREMTGAPLDKAGADIFRQLIVRDSNALPTSQSLGIFQLKILNIGYMEDNPEAVVIWKKGGRGNVATYEEADSLYWEMLRPDIEFETEVVIDRNLNSILRLFMPMLEKPAFDIQSENILQCLNNLGKHIIAQELKYAETYKIPYLIDFYQNLQKNCEAAAQSGKMAYFPIGYGVPWHSKTVGSLLDTSSLDAIRRYFYRYMGKFVHVPCRTSFHGLAIKRGQCPKCGKQLRPDKLECVEPFPKTRHMVFSSGKPCVPPGWICVSTE